MPFLHRIRPTVMEHTPMSAATARILVERASQNLLIQYYNSSVRLLRGHPIPAFEIEQEPFSAVFYEHCRR